MVGGILIIAAGTVRRMLSLPALLIALLAGAGAGLLLLRLPAPSLVPEAFGVLVRVLAAMLVLPLAASVPTADRLGGYEQLVALRPISSLAWTLGRVLGSVLGMATLVLLLGACARWVAGELPMPDAVTGQRMASELTDPMWRFALPAGQRGPFDLELGVVPRGPGSKQLTLLVTRGDGVLTLEPTVYGRSRLVVPVPDLWPERGDLFVTLRAGPRLSLSDAPPQLIIGSVPLGREQLPLPTAAAAGLALALLTALAAACAFHFETACLAGLAALVVELPAQPWIWPAAVAALLVIATLGTALQRRSAMP